MQNTVELCLNLWYHHKVYEKVYGRSFEGGPKGCRSGGSAHAEIEAIRQAAKNLGGWRLIGCDMYVTAEPCAMCAGAIVWSRIETLYIGAMDPKAGACGSVFNIVQEKKLNHNVRIETGLLQDQCSNILKEFFKKLRKTKEQEPEDTKK